MSARAAIFGSIFLLSLGYIFYARIVERFLEINPENITPANKYFDGIDYVPARSWLVLFGHHFASIAGAGPIVGPVIAVAIWGFWPALLWIVLGTIFFGAVHDFAAIVISIRHRARSIADIAEDVISRRSKMIFLGFVWLSLILVIAVFTDISAKTLISQPEAVMPCFGLILTALIVGFMLYRIKVNILLSTSVGLMLLITFIKLGDMFPVNIGPNAFIIWALALLIYAFVASVAPVQILLQPRDYISSFLLYFGIIAGFLGILIKNPGVNAEMFGGWKPQGADWLWPMLFVTIACGANSGFHALVSSGTTSKQIANERDAKKIGYGGMALEAFLAVIALLTVSAGLSTSALKLMLSKNGPGPIGAFSMGYGNLTDFMLFGKGQMFAVLILNAFVLTTLDTATRICRYLSEELFKIKNRFLATFVVIFTSGVFALSGKWNKIWPVFGASNQLVAALTFIVISSWLLCKKKSVKFTFIPAVFMLLTSVGALLYQLAQFARNGNFVLIFITAALVVLAGAMVFDVVMAIKKKGLKCKII